MLSSWSSSPLVSKQLYINSKFAFIFCGAHKVSLSHFCLQQHSIELLVCSIFRSSNLGHGSTWSHGTVTCTQLVKDYYSLQHSADLLLQSRSDERIKDAAIVVPPLRGTGSWINFKLKSLWLWMHFKLKLPHFCLSRHPFYCITNSCEYKLTLFIFKSIH